jgi:hypothetical protein
LRVSSTCRLMARDDPRTENGRQGSRESEQTEAEYDMFRSGLALIALSKPKSLENIALFRMCVQAPVKRWLCLACGKSASSSRVTLFSK